MKYLLLFAITIIMCDSIFCQTNLKSYALINLDENKAFQEIEIQNNVLALDKLPDTLMIEFPNDNIGDYTIQFNIDSSKDKFNVGFNIPSNQSNANIPLNRIVKGTIILSFADGYLLPLQDNDIKRKVNLDKSGKPYIKIVKTKKNSSTDPFDVFKTKEPQKWYQPEEINIYSNPFYCGSLVCPNCNKDYAPVNVNFPSPDSIFGYSKPENGADEIPQYVIVYNDVKKFPTYYINKGGNLIPYSASLQKMHPVVGSALPIAIIGPVDSVYSITSNGADKFMDSAAAAAASVTKTGPNVPAITKTNNPGGGPGGAPNASQALIKQMQDSIAIAELKTNLSDLATEVQILRKSIDSLKNNPQKNASANTAEKTINNLLTSLDEALELFNHQYESIDFKETEYKDALLCLQMKIKILLNNFAVENADSLTSSLINFVIPGIESSHYNYFSKLIKSIQAQYASATSKKAKYTIFRKYITIPNQDIVNINFNTKSRNFDSLSFNVKGGFKIDFSTGLFVTGLSNSAFVLGQHTFRYKGTKDFILPSGQDSIAYTGNVLDTTGNFIYTNKKINFNTGVLIHGYWRNGKIANAGIAVGAMLDNNTQLLWLIGGSILLNAGNSRIAISGGAAIGKEMVISSELQRYSWNSSINDSTLYNSINNVPKFYIGTSNIPTYYKTNLNWFFAITYNFATITTGNKK